MRGGSIEPDDGARVVDTQAFWKAVVEAIKGGKPPLDAIRDAAATHLGVMGQSDVVARVTIAIAREFGRENGLSLMDDGMALGRIAQAYVKAIPSLSEKGEADMNLPFLAVTKNGPVHYAAILTPAKLAELLARDAKPQGTPASPAPLRALSSADASETPGDPPPKKRGFWPFR
jgi:hypothetical protein